MKKEPSKFQKISDGLRLLWQRSDSRVTFQEFCDIWADDQIERIEKRISNLTHQDS